MTNTIDISGMKFKRPVSPQKPHIRLFRKLRLAYINWQYRVLMRRTQRSIDKLRALDELAQEIKRCS